MTEQARAGGGIIKDDGSTLATLGSLMNWIKIRRITVAGYLALLWVPVAGTPLFAQHGLPAAGTVNHGALAWPSNATNDLDEPSWGASLEGVMLFRLTAEPFELARSLSNSTTLNVSDVDFEMTAGPQVSLVRRWPDSPLDVRLKYFGLSEWVANRQYAGNLILSAPGFQAGINGANLDVRYQSQLDSGTAAVHWQALDGFGLEAGFRWVSLNEQFQGVVTAAAAHQLDYEIDTDNDLFGFQIGGDIGFTGPLPSMYWSIFANAGIYYHDARRTVDGSVSILLPVPMTAAPAAGTDPDRVAFVGETGLSLGVDLNRFLALRGGYQVMWLNGVALAPDQIPVSSINAVSVNPVFLDASGKLFLHGAVVGLEGTW